MQGNFDNSKWREQIINDEKYFAQLEATKKMSLDDDFISNHNIDNGNGK